MSACADLIEKSGTDTRAICRNYGLCNTPKARTTTRASGRDTVDVGKGSSGQEAEILRRTVVWIAVDGR